VAKNHAAQIIPEASNVFRIGCRAETLGELEELFLFALLGLDPLFHELNDDPVGAKASLLRQAAHMPRRVCRKAHGLANNFVGSRHDTIIHQNGDARSSALGASVAQTSGFEVCGSSSDSRFRIQGLPAPAEGRTAWGGTQKEM